MKRRKAGKYAPKLEEQKPICPICGKHTIETETEDVRYKLDGEVFTMKEAFFRCKQDGECYATDDMVAFNNSQLRAYMLKREIEKKDNPDNKVRVPSSLKFKQ